MRLLFVLAGALASAAFLGAGCGESNDGAPRPDGGTEAGDVTEAQKNAEGLFRALQEELVKTCGGTGGICHVSGQVEDAPRFLAPDPYVSIKKHRGIIPDDNVVENSSLLTRDEHAGPSLRSTLDLWNRVRTWIAAEINADPLPTSQAFSVSLGPNTVDLSGVKEGMSGAKLSFLAQIGGGILTMSEMKITAPTARGIRMTSPFFVIVPEKGPTISDSENGFAGELELEPAQTKDLYGGTLLILKWQPTSKLQLSFDKLEVLPAPDGGTTGGCKSVATFTASAVPAFKIDLGGGQTCLTCHGGGNDVAVNAMDLTKVDTDDAAACAQARNHINFADRPQSPIIATPTGNANGNPNHPVKNAPPSFVSGVLTWIQAE
jgi:hypothetical protein